MNHTAYLSFVLLAACATTDAANAEPAPPPPPAPRVAGTPSSRDGTVKRVLRTPRGDVDGLILDDGTVVRVPPHALRSAAPAIGAKVHAEGSLSDATLRAEALTIAGAKLDLAPPATPPPPPAEGPALAMQDESATIAVVVRNPEGMPDALILSDGATVRIGPPMFAAATALREGAAIKVHGEGGRYGDVVAMHARTLEVAGTTYRDEGPPAPPAGPPRAP